jgi:hypothetical protein
MQSLDGFFNRAVGGNDQKPDLGYCCFTNSKSSAGNFGHDHIADHQVNRLFLQNFKRDHSILSDTDLIALRI